MLSQNVAVGTGTGAGIGATRVSSRACLRPVAGVEKFANHRFWSRLKEGCVNVSLASLSGLVNLPPHNAYREETKWEFCQTLTSLSVGQFHVWNCGSWPEPLSGNLLDQRR